MFGGIFSSKNTIKGKQKEPEMNGGPSTLPFLDFFLALQVLLEQFPAAYVGRLYSEGCCLDATAAKKTKIDASPTSVGYSGSLHVMDPPQMPQGEMRPGLRVPWLERYLGRLELHSPQSRLGTDWVDFHVKR